MSSGPAGERTTVPDERLQSVADRLQNKFRSSPRPFDDLALFIRDPVKLINQVVNPGVGLGNLAFDPLQFGRSEFI